jgi:hypothetical protein
MSHDTAGTLVLYTRKTQSAAVPVVRVWIACAFQPCPTAAFVRLRRRQGWANVCLGHYEDLATLDARAWCAEHGLESHSARREWLGRQSIPGCRAALAQPRREREPGEDEEEGST